MPLLVRRHPARRLSKKDQSLARLENFKKEIVTDSHIVPLDELCVRLETDPVTGLTPQQAKEILTRTGPNALTPSKKKSEIAKYFHAVTHGFSMLLWLGAGLCFISVLIAYCARGEIDQDNLVLGIVLVVVVIATGSFMYYQEHQSQSIMDSFSNMVPPKATVIRGGETMTIMCREVVIGDLVDIKFGDRVPADIRIIHSQGLKVDNSPLTGEAEPQPRTNNYTDVNFLETKNIAYFSTNVLEGIGRGIAVGCGDHTVMGHIAGMTARLQPNKTPMAKELDRFMKIISCWACCLGILLGITALCLKYHIIDALLFVIGIIVANVPEGLLATVTLSLTITARRMAARNCMVKNLEAVETLGSTSVICSDKTGTLTQNKMTVCHIWYNNKIIPIHVHADQAKTSYRNETAFHDLIRCANLCSRAEFLPNQDHIPILSKKVRGDASEEAILKFVKITEMFPDGFRARNPKLIEIPFSSSTKYQVSVHALETGRCMVVMKGAPEIVMDRCSTILYNNETVNMNERMREMCDKACLTFAEMGERVLGFCDLTLSDPYQKTYKYTTEPTNFPTRGLRFIGLIAMIDPPRPQVFDAVKKCKGAGIKVVMVTGDHPVTAKSIATQVGIIREGNAVLEIAKVESLQERSFSGEAVVVHGSALRDINSDELDDLLFHYKEIVFARTSPTQKLQIVESFQRLGEIVSVTGDGVNDAPALKKADIGIAMGITGTEVSQQAADIILLDDNFSSIIVGIEEGRKIFDNLKKSITYTLSSNVPEILPFVAFALLSIPLPLGILAILTIDLLTDMMPAICLAYEKAESDIMLRPPRNPKRDKLVTRKLYFLAYGHIGMIEALCGFYMYFIVMAEHGFWPGKLIGLRSDWESKEEIEDSFGILWTHEERKVLECTCYTMFMISIVITQWADLIVCKTRVNSIFKQGMMNWPLNISLVVETILALLLSNLPYMDYLKFYPVQAHWWALCLPFAIFIFLFDEFRKWHIRKHARGWYQRETSY